VITNVLITQLPDSSDARGLSVSLPATTIDHLTVRDVHIASIRPGHVRGNHYHARKTELTTVVYSDNWSLHWDTGAGTPVSCRAFSGHGAVSIIFPFFWSHAVKNDGAQDLWLFNATDLAFDPSAPGADLDAQIRKVV
jgi:hypothetical protein